MNILVDFHHSSLLRSFVLLFENRLGHKVYRPIGMEWYEEGYWDIFPSIETAKQFLLPNHSEILDNTSPLNDVYKKCSDELLISDPGGDSYHRAIFLSSFKDMEFDIVIASIPQHINIFKNLIKNFQPKAKFIFQVGNNWSIDNNENYNVMFSTKPFLLPSNINGIFYHQEFDLNFFKPSIFNKFNRISSYINVLQTNLGWNDFLSLENLLHDVLNFQSFGGQCRDGTLSGPRELSNSMNSNDFIFHVKYGGDGYGHILYNSYACGKPVIIRSSYYKNCLGEELFNYNNCIDLDSMSLVDACKTIIDIYNDDEKLKIMGENAHLSFINNVSFDHDADRIKKWLESL